MSSAAERPGVLGRSGSRPNAEADRLTRRCSGPHCVGPLNFSVTAQLMDGVR